MGIDVSRLKAMAPKPTRSNVTDNVITKEDSDMNKATTTATVNNTTAKETKMNKEIKTSAQTASEFAVKFQEMGYEACIPTLGGVAHPELMFGYKGEEDGEAAMELINAAFAAANGNIYNAMCYMANAAKTSALEIKADEAVDVDGVDIVISYEKRKAYKDGEEVANLDSVPSTCPLPNEAIKNLLIEKVREMINHRPYNPDEDEDWDY